MSSLPWSLLPGCGPRVCLVDLAVFKPPQEWKLDQAAVDKFWRDTQRYRTEDVDFCNRIQLSSGLSRDRTYLPPWINPQHCGNDPQTDLNSAQAEARLAMTGAVQALLDKTGLHPRDIDILVTTCSIYCPTPSLASLLVNAFGMRPDVQSYSLGGMGCANGVVAVNLLADLLKARPNCNALFVTIEATTPAFYRGNERPRLVTNMLFRTGAAAVLLSNKPRLAARAKYALRQCVRVHTGASAEAYGAIHYSPDASGLNGIFLGKNVVAEASRGLALALRRVAPHVLTWGQLAEAVAAEVRGRMGRGRGGNREASGGGKEGRGGEGEGKLAPPAAAMEARAGGTLPAPTSSSSKAPSGGVSPPPRRSPSSSSSSSPSYRPNFQQSTVRHFLLHAGGAKVLDGLGEALQLDEGRLGPSRAVLRDYGNVSSSSTWYALAHVETEAGVRAGERLMQVGVGSGMKSGVNVWQALRDVREVHPAWAHLLSPEQQQRLGRQVDVSHALRHMMGRLMLALALAALAIALGAAAERAGMGAWWA
ncbi:hypothetical protein HYH03_002477 [Edaphochlamys debaryana]|uniref:3-ketoacyl-CoA synthase n=1 Tax=Edaphochlamys debaryana TaxID=47281 RepID=A0A835YBE7_9CHLO|nr:hypothetical protein HYH03_002477 [Edaphochlamys debaryana]|eukprot:KAG2499531.1 hypothetical protein HYH03_002477 [Edaphochlamys debaryana]